MNDDTRFNRNATRRGVRALFAIVALACVMSGCAVVTVVGTAATLAATAASTAVDIGVGAVRVTGKVIGTGVDLVTPSSSPKPAAPSKP